MEEVTKVQVTTEKKIRLIKANYSMEKIMEYVKANYLPCEASINDTDDADNYIVTLKPIQ